MCVLCVVLVCECVVCVLVKSQMDCCQNRKIVHKFFTAENRPNRIVFSRCLCLWAHKEEFHPPLSLSRLVVLSSVIFSFTFFLCLTHTPSYMHNGRGEWEKEGEGPHLMAKCALSVAINSIGTD